MLNKKIQSVKNFARAHKTGIAVTVTAVTCMALNRAVVKSHNDFLKEKGLYDEYYYAPEEDNN